MMQMISAPSINVKTRFNETTLFYCYDTLYKDNRTTVHGWNVMIMRLLRFCSYVCSYLSEDKIHI